MGVGHWKSAALKMLHPRCNHGQGGQGAAGLESVYPRICISLGRKGQQSCNTAPFHSVPPSLTQNGLQETGFPRETPAGKEAGLGVTPMPQRARLGGSCSPWGRSGGDPGASEVSWLETGARWSQCWEPLAAPPSRGSSPARHRGALTTAPRLHKAPVSPAHGAAPAHESVLCWVPRGAGSGKQLPPRRAGPSWALGASSLPCTTRSLCPGAGLPCQQGFGGWNVAASRGKCQGCLTSGVCQGRRWGKWAHLSNP